MIPLLFFILLAVGLGVFALTYIADRLKEIRDLLKSCVGDSHPCANRPSNDAH